MDAINTANHLATRMTAPGWPPVGAELQRLEPNVPLPRDGELRQRLGEFVGNIFYGMLIRQMNESGLKGEYFHGGRGEDVFKAQLGMELAQRLGRAANDPITNRLYEAMARKRLEDDQASQESAAPHEAAAAPTPETIDTPRGEA